MRGIALLLSLLALLAGLAESADPTAAQVNAAIEAWQKAHPSTHPETKVRDVAACFPALEPGSSFVCLMQVASPEGSHLTPVSLQPASTSFVLAVDASGAPKDLEPACPPLREAEDFLRRVLHSSQLHVKSFGTGPEGSFTDERGKFTKHPAPERLMCSYTFTNGDLQRLAVTYVWRKNGVYTFEDEFEDWDDD